MKAARKLFGVQCLHTVIWIFFNIVIFYLLYAALTDRIDARFWTALALIAGEGLVLLLFGNRCPLTVIARRYSNSTRANFDIWLPEWLARYNKTIYLSIVTLALLIAAFRHWL